MTAHDRVKSQLARSLSVDPKIDESIMSAVSARALHNIQNDASVVYRQLKLVHEQQLIQLWQYRLAKPREIWPTNYESAN